MIAIKLSIVWLFTPLRDLDLSHTLVTDDGIKLIRQLPNLEFVDLSNTPISDDFVSQLRKDMPGDCTCAGYFFTA